MCPTIRKRKSRRNKKTNNPLFTIFLIFVIITIVGAAIAYFLYDIGKPNNNTPTKTHVITTKKNVTKPIKAPAKSILEGTWVSSADGRMLEIHGNSFTMELPSVSEHKIIKGKLTITGNTATIIYVGTKDKCAENPGIYSLIIKKGSIRFKVKHDDCPGRKQIFSTTWEKF